MPTVPSKYHPAVIVRISFVLPPITMLPGPALQRIQIPNADLARGDSGHDGPSWDILFDEGECADAGALPNLYSWKQHCSAANQ